MRVATTFFRPYLGERGFGGDGGGRLPNPTGIRGTPSIHTWHHSRSLSHSGNGKIANSAHSMPPNRQGTA